MTDRTPAEPLSAEEEATLRDLMRFSDGFGDEQWILALLATLDRERARDLGGAEVGAHQHDEAFCDACVDYGRQVASLRDLGGAEGLRALDWPTLANVIREVDGNHDLGAGELAERILSHPRVAATPPEPAGLNSERLAQAVTIHRQAVYARDHLAYLDHSCMGDCSADIAARYAALRADGAER